MIKNIFNEKKLVLISNKKELDKFINNSKYKSYNKLLMLIKIIIIIAYLAYKFIIIV